jgi:hypothetical protein
MSSLPARVSDRLRSGLKRFQSVVQSAKSRDVNESDTVTIVTDMLSDLFGYDKYSEVTSELSIRGTRCDLATKLDGKTQVLFECKAVGTELKENHTRQAIDYAANSGIEWVVLTNAVSWRIYRVIFGRPVDQELVLDLDLLSLNSKNDENIQSLYLLSKEGWSKAALKEYDTQRQALSRFCIGAVIVSEPILRMIRRRLRGLAPNVSVELDQIKEVLLREVLKRDVIEGDKADEARKRVNRAENRAKKSKAATEIPADVIAAAAGSTSTT